MKNKDSHTRTVEISEEAIDGLMLLASYAQIAWESGGRPPEHESERLAAAEEWLEGLG